jgi:hypothetical protein
MRHMLPAALVAAMVGSAMLAPSNVSAAPTTRQSAVPAAGVVRNANPEIVGIEQPRQLRSSRRYAHPRPKHDSRRYGDLRHYYSDAHPHYSYYYPFYYPNYRPYPYFAPRVAMIVGPVPFYPYYGSYWW